MFNDGIQTVIYASGIYAQEQLGLDSDQLILAILIVQFVAVGGAVVRPGGGPDRRLPHRAGQPGPVVRGDRRGLLPALRRVPAFAGLAALIGLTLGGTQALSRSLYSHLIPRGREAEYFSLYAACERGTSWLGTLAFGLTFQLTGSYRYAIIVLIAFFTVGAVLLSRVNVARESPRPGTRYPQSSEVTDRGVVTLGDGPLTTC